MFPPSKARAFLPSGGHAERSKRVRVAVRRRFVGRVRRGQLHVGFELGVQRDSGDGRRSAGEPEHTAAVESKYELEGSAKSFVSKRW